LKDCLSLEEIKEIGELFRQGEAEFSKFKFYFENGNSLSDFYIERFSSIVEKIGNHLKKHNKE